MLLVGNGGGVGGWGGQKQKHERDMRETPSGTRV